MTIHIDLEFKKLIPPLIKEDYDRLEESLRKEGCREALVLWGDTLVDGHNRYEICTKHNIPFKTTAKDFVDRNEAMLWMIENQLARRNLSTADRIILAKKQEPILAAIAKAKQQQAGKENGRGMNDEIASVKSDISYSTEKPRQHSATKSKKKPAPTVREQIAKAAGVSSGTVAKFEIVQEEKPELIEEIRNKTMSIDAAYNQVKQEKKKRQVQAAEKAVQAQVQEADKPVLHIGSSIGYQPAEKYDLLLTDPPYSTDVDNIEQFVNDWLYNALDYVKDTGFAYVFIGAYPDELKAYLNATLPSHIALCQQLIWTYKNTLGNNPKDKYKQNYQVCLFYRGVNAPDLDCPLTSEQWAVQEINAPDGRQGDRYHAWQKPMEIAERFIRHSTKQGMTVFDPFVCTGTFLLAASKLGRKAYGFEINPDNAKIAEDRGCVIDG